MQRANVLPNSFWQISWPIVLAANLIVPLILGLEVTREGGRRGMGLAITLVWLMGHLACARSKAIAPRLVIGGFFVGLSQLYPVLQVMAGMVALDIVSQTSMVGLNLIDMQYRLTELGGFLTTFLMGGQLVFAAILSGFAVAVVAKWLGPHDEVAGEPIAPPDAAAYTQALDSISHLPPCR